MHLNPLSYFPLFSCKACQEHIFSSSDPELFDPHPSPLIDQKIHLFTSLLFTCLLATTTYCIYLYCFQAKEIEPGLDSIEERTRIIAATQLLHPNLEQQDVPITPTLEQVIQNAQEMHLKLKENPLFPRLSDRYSTAIEQIKVLYDDETILHAFQNTRLLIHPSINPLIDGFLQYKLTFGSHIEKELYSSMSQESFIARLITKRPLTFSGKSDAYKLRDGSIGSYGKFNIVGTDQEKLIQLKDYISYDEMEIAALIGVSTPSQFINKGAVLNEGSMSKVDDYETKGTCFALVGARLERENYMEFQRIMVTSNQNTKENGYGPLPENEELDNAITAKMRLFARFYNVEYFPTYDEISTNDNHLYSKCSSGFINESLYKHRIKIAIENFLIHANKNGEEHGQSIYAQPYGWGLDNWIQDSIQRQWFIEVFLEVIQNCDFPFISDVDFSCVMKYQNANPKLKKFHERDGQKLNEIKLHFPNSKECRQPCEKLSEEHSNKRLANSYNWNANAYPGNEYWTGQLSASSASTMMCASPLQLFALMPEINPYLTKVTRSSRPGSH